MGITLTGGLAVTLVVSLIAGSVLNGKEY